jgi:NAD(P)-dependent dehydrogenase (short-subunit alcohol dehydrogenase family)
MTGGASGIGKATAMKLAAKGVTVVGRDGPEANSEDGDSKHARGFSHRVCDPEECDGGMVEAAGVEPASGGRRSGRAA